MQNKSGSYESYLLRFRRIQTDYGHTWVPSMQSTATGEHFRFLSLDKLLEFLCDEFGEGESGVHEVGIIDDEDR